MVRVLAAGRARRWLALVLVIAVAAATAATAALANGTIAFDGSVGTQAPPARLEGIRMLVFGRDHRHRGTHVTSVHGPTGRIRFSHAVFHEVVKHVTSQDPRKRAGYWLTWGHGYHGDAYWVNPSTIITLPSETTAFSFYAEPEDPQAYSVTASASGATSGPVKVRGLAGARFFGFVASGGATLTTIEVSSNDDYVNRKHPGGFAIGEFAIHGAG